MVSSHGSSPAGLRHSWAPCSKKLIPELNFYWVIPAATQWYSLELTGRDWRPSPNKQSWISYSKNSNIIHISDRKILQKVHFEFGVHVTFNKCNILSARTGILYFLLASSYSRCFDSLEVSDMWKFQYHAAHSFHKKIHKSGRLVQVAKVLGRQAFWSEFRSQHPWNTPAAAVYTYKPGAREAEIGPPRELSGQLVYPHQWAQGSVREPVSWPKVGSHQRILLV
jgi:hypothetical protein